MHVLLWIDLQNDFLPGGALAVPDGDQVIEVANRAIETAQHVVATQDWHPADHGSFASQHEGMEAGQGRTTGWHEYLKSIGASELSVMGLATDYGVKFTVLDALWLGYPARVLLAGCCGVNLRPGDLDAAIEEMRAAGAEIVEPYTPLF